MMADKSMTETALMLIVLGLIDVVMISNLLVMVIVGGWETFVSRLDLKNHPDQPEWLSHVNAGVLKVKLATAIIGISSIHLLKTFINASSYYEKTRLWQTCFWVDSEGTAMSHSQLLEALNFTRCHMDELGVRPSAKRSKSLCSLIHNCL
jgi:uncharacterized protein (TIGR00645 family)